MHHDFTHAYGDEQGWQEYCDTCITDFRRLSVGWGYSAITTRCPAGYGADNATHHRQHRRHLAWLVPLLKEYYDPMYRYHLRKKRKKLSFAVSGRKWRNG